MGDGQDRQDAVDESADLAEVVASLDEPEPGDELAEPAPAGPEAPADIPESSASEPVDPEISALQTELDSEGEPPVAEDSGVDAATAPEPLPAEPVAEAPVETVAVEPASAEPTVVGDEQTALYDTKDIALPDDRAGIPIWPFLVYIGLWIVFAGLFVWQALQVPAGTALYELNLYGLSILVGLILTALGPLLAIGVWLACWLARPGARSGLFSRSLIIGAVTTLAGVALWLMALGAVDMLRLGRLL
jgi:hypothetical protein